MVKRVAALPSRLLAGRFEIVRQLGAGGFGAVYEAIDREWDATLALKTLEKWSADALRRFKHEFRCLQEITHPNLVHLRELLSADDQWFFTMELVRGSHFLDYVRPPLSGAGGPGRRTRHLNSERLRPALAQLVEGLCALHAAGHAHCDVKPSNILVETNGRLVLLDFGLLAQLQADTDDSDELVGTPDYMSPEQILGEPITAASDWYAVGVMLYQALTGRFPFPFTGIASLQCKLDTVPLHPREVHPYAPEDLSDLCHAMLAMEPGDRPTNQQLLAQLVSANDNQPAPSRRRSLRSRKQSCFVGRATELSQLRALMHEPREGAHFVFISGESGVGKTELALHFIAQVQLDHRSVVLQTRCYERESLPFKGFDGIVDDLSLHLDKLPPDVLSEVLADNCPALAKAFPVFEPFLSQPDERMYAIAKEPHVQRVEAFGALRAILRRLGEHHPLVLLIDDLQWADRDSLQLLRELLLGHGAPRCLIVATARPVAEWLEDLGDELPQLLALPATTSLRLGGLSESEAHALLRHQDTDALDARHLRLLLDETRGNPLFISELAGALHALAPQRVFAEALAERIGALETALSDMLQCLALARRPLPHRVLARAFELDLNQLDRRLAALRMARLSRSAGRDREECYHDLVTRGTLAQLTTRERIDRCQALARALTLETDSDPAELADLWQEAGELAQAARLRIVAAGNAAQNLAFHRAANLYEAALEAPDTFASDELSDLRTAYADALSCAGYAQKAAQLLLEVAEARQGDARHQLRRRAARLLLQSGDLQQGFALTDSLLREVHTQRPRSPGAAIATILWERARLGIAMRSPEPTSNAASKPPDDRSLETLWAVALPLAFADLLAGTAVQARYSRLAVRSRDPVHVARALASEVLVRATLDRPPRTRLAELMERSKALAEQVQEPYLYGLCDMACGFVLLTEQQSAAAIPALQAAERNFREHCVDVAWETTNARAMLLNAHWNHGNLREHSRLSREWLADARDRGDRYALAQLHVMGMAYYNGLTLDDPEAALYALEESLAGWTGTDFQLPHWTQYIGRQLVGLYCADGSAYRIVTETRAVLERSRLLRAPYLALLTRLDAGWATLERALVSHDAEREGLLRETRRYAKQVQQTDWPLSSAMALQLLGQVAVLEGDRLKAISALTEAHQAFQRLSSIYVYPTAYLLGALIGGSDGQALCENSLNWCTRQGVVRPQRLLTCFAPVLRVAEP